MGEGRGVEVLMLLTELELVWVSKGERTPPKVQLNKVVPEPIVINGGTLLAPFLAKTKWVTGVTRWAPYQI